MKRWTRWLLVPGAAAFALVPRSGPRARRRVVQRAYGRRLGLAGQHLGEAGKQIGQFGAVNSLDCRGAGDLLVGEVGNWRVQRVHLQ